MKGNWGGSGSKPSTDRRTRLPWPTWYMPQEKAPTAARKIATALGPLLGMRRAYLTGRNPPGGGPSWRTGISLTLAIPGFFRTTDSVILPSPITTTAIAKHLRFLPVPLLRSIEWIDRSNRSVAVIREGGGVENEEGFYCYCDGLRASPVVLRILR